MTEEKKRDIPWTAAEEAVGEEAKSDWLLEPLAHAERLGPEAARLKAVLTQPGIEAHMQAYERFDAEAIRMQNRYRFWRRALRALIALAALTGLAALGLFWYVGRVDDWVLLCLLPHGLLVGGIGLLALLFRLRDWRGGWKAARGEAEMRRIAIFAEACKPNPPGAEAAVEAPAGVTLLDLLPLQLAYFRRYQLDVQLNYFKGRGAQLRRVKATPRWLSVPAMLAAAACFALALLLLLSLLAEQGVALPVWLLGLLRPEAARAAPWLLPLLLLSSYYALRVDVDPSEDAQNGERYDALYGNLKYLKDHGYAAAQRAAERNDPAPVGNFVNLVHDRLRAENERWLSLTDLDADAQAAVTGLSDLLAAEKKLKAEG